MSSFTPGPWRARVMGVADHCNPPREIFQIDGANGSNVCELAFAEDANLIAAAPSLYEALEKCAAVCAGETMSKSGLIEALESARAALSAARGEAK